MAWTFQPNFTIRDDQTTFGNLIMDSSVVPIIENLIIDVLQDKCDVTKYGDLLDNKVFTNESYSAAQSEYELIKTDISEFNHILGGLATFDGILKVAGNSVQYIAGSQSWIQSYINLKNEAGMLYKRIKSNKGYYNLNPTKEAEWDRRYTEVMSTITRADEHNRMIGLAMERYNADIAKGVSMREARDEAVTALRNSGVPEEVIRQKFGLMAAVQVDSTKYEVPVETTNINTSENNYLITAEFMRSTLDKIEKLPAGSDVQFMARVQIGYIFMQAMKGPYDTIMLKGEVEEFFRNGMSYSKTPENKDLAAKNLNWLVSVATNERNVEVILRNAYTVKKDMIDSFFTTLSSNDNRESVQTSKIRVTSDVLCKWYEDILVVTNPSIKYRALGNIGLWMINIAQENSILLDARTVQMFNNITGQGNLDNMQLESCVGNMMWALTRTYQIQFDSADIIVDKSWVDINIYIKESDNQTAFKEASPSTPQVQDQPVLGKDYIHLTTEVLLSWVRLAETTGVWSQRDSIANEIADYLTNEMPYVKWYNDDSKLFDKLDDHYRWHKEAGGKALLEKIKPFVELLHNQYSSQFAKENFTWRVQSINEKIYCREYDEAGEKADMISINYDNLVKWYHDIESYPNLDVQVRVLANIGDLIIAHIINSSMSIPLQQNQLIKNYRRSMNASMYYGPLREAVTQLIDLTVDEKYIAIPHEISEVELHRDVLCTNESKFK